MKRSVEKRADGRGVCAAKLKTVRFSIFLDRLLLGNAAKATRSANINNITLLCIYRVTVKCDYDVQQSAHLLWQTIRRIMLLRYNTWGTLVTCTHWFCYHSLWLLVHGTGGKERERAEIKMEYYRRTGSLAFGGAGARERVSVINLNTAMGTTGEDQTADTRRE